jgi:hypothetical protein
MIRKVITQIKGYPAVVYLAQWPDNAYMRTCTATSDLSVLSDRELEELVEGSLWPVKRSGSHPLFACIIVVWEATAEEVIFQAAWKAVYSGLADRSQIVNDQTQHPLILVELGERTRVAEQSVDCAGSEQRHCCSPRREPRDRRMASLGMLVPGRAT